MFTIFSLKAQTSKYISTDFNTTAKKAEFLLYLANNYSTNAYAILNTKRSDFYTQWVKGSSHYQVLSSYAAVIHETCHAINSDIGGFWSNGFYISSLIQIKVAKTPVFKSNAIDPGIPNEWKSRILRYKIYIVGIDGNDELNSICNGIYGLLDEFVAYYQSTRAVVELFDYYKAISIYNLPYYWTLYITNCQSSIFAYYEFRLFMAWYLQHARFNYPLVYQSIMNNKNLRAVYTLTDKGYQKVIDQYFINRNFILENINKSAVLKAELAGNYFQITTKSSRGSKTVGYGIPDNEIAYLKSLFTESDLRMLKMFSMDKMNEMNYKLFLD